MFGSLVILLKILREFFLMYKRTCEEVDRSFFVSFCVEQYKKHIGATGNVVIDLFDSYGVTEYLYENYDVLHTQGAQWLMVEIEEFVIERKARE